MIIMGKMVLNDSMKKHMFARIGNTSRLRKVFEKALRGEPICFVALGGSITQRFNASSEESCYAFLTFKWLERRFPKSDVKYVNAGIGATGSLIALHRLQHDVLAYNPDIVIVEFSVNESDGAFTEESYDNLMFNLLHSPTHPAVIPLGMVDSRGKSAQKTHLKVAEYYNLPFLSYRDAVWGEIEAGRLKWQDTSDDIIHPTDDGHAVAAEIITEYFKKVLNDKTQKEYVLPDKNLTNVSYCNAQILYAGEVNPNDMGCFKLKKVNLNKMHFGWYADENGAPLVFEFENCSRIFVLFEKTNSGTGGRATVTVGGKETALDADFKDGWGVYSNTAYVFNNDEPQKVVLKIQPQLETGKHFTVIGIMLS